MKHRKKPPTKPSPKSPQGPTDPGSSATPTSGSPTSLTLEIVPAQRLAYLNRDATEPGLSADTIIRQWEHDVRTAHGLNDAQIPAHALVVTRALEDLRATGNLFAGTYRAFVALIAQYQMPRQELKTIASQMGFPDSRTSEFARIAYGPEPIRQSFLAGEQTFRAALRAVRADKAPRKKRHPAPNPNQSEFWAATPFVDPAGHRLIRITLTLPAEARVMDVPPLLTDPAHDKALRWQISVSAI